ncbi:hypothetical protein [Deinococcus frigens]|uniref:hypothetical protein n=1 Tax=Deinococcus frigens TaxID=249403 RepID=UPI0012EC3B60|nr:hypothetical protein [Deinococcus frigens]
MKPLLTQPAPALASQTAEYALSELRALARSDPAVALRLSRLGRLLAHGRAIRVDGPATAVAATWTALRGFAERHLSAHVHLRREVVTAQALLARLRAPTHVLLVNPRNEGCCEYLITPQGEDIRVCCSDRRERLLSRAAFLGLFQTSSYRLLARPADLLTADLPARAA